MKMKIPESKRVEICKMEYVKNAKFKEYCDRFMRKEQKKSLNDVFKEVIIYDICMFYKNNKEK